MAGPGRLTVASSSGARHRLERVIEHMPTGSHFPEFDGHSLVLRVVLIGLELLSIGEGRHQHHTRSGFEP